MGNIDIRILKLNKWYVPKTHVFAKVKGNVAIGHFDSVEIRGRQIGTDKEHPFIGGYHEMIKWKTDEKKSLVDHSSQELMIFTNIDEEENKEDGSGFLKETIHSFWADNSSPYLFISLIHIEHMGKLKAALKQIREVFQKHYLSYVSFDYCDIIIFAKRLYIKEFLSKVRELCLWDEKNTEKVFFDSFSIITFGPDYVNLKCGTKPETGEFLAGSDEDKFQATVNVSVKNYPAFSSWCEEVKKKYPEVEFYNMYGRHDVSIVNNEADTEWLMYIMDELHKKRDNVPFWTFETFIKLKGDIDKIENYSGDGKDITKKLYKTVRRELEDKIEKLRQEIEASSLVNKSSFLLPIYEARDCVCSIVKNNFAEEFVYCVYDSFQHFIQYMTECMEKLNQGKGYDIVTETKMAGSYNKYFTALNTLVNSTMHSERQFVQTTSFNAIFYSVPPKIMAFYNAYIYRLKDILRDDASKEEYSYLIYPSFSPIMTIEQVSLNDKPPCSRVLTAKISEKTIYDMAPVSYQLVHELAHYIGDQVRCRDKRAKYMFHSLLQSIIIASNIQDKKLMGFLDIYLDEIWLEKNRDKIYLQDFEKNSGVFFKNLKDDFAKETYDSFMEYCNSSEKEIPGDELLREFGLPEDARNDYRRLYFPQYFKYVCKRIKEQLESMQGVDKWKPYNEDVKLLKEIYSESYADLQMILILAVSPQDYLNMFSRNSILPMEKLFYSPEDAIRISLIFKVMVDSGIWEKSYGNDASFAAVISEMLQYNEKNFRDADDKKKAFWNEKKCKIRVLAESYIENGTGVDSDKRINEVEYSVGDVSKWVKLEDFDYIIYGLYNYLLDVTQEALEEYSRQEKKEKIRNIHKTIKTILEDENIVNVYNCIEEEIGLYRKALFGDI